MIRPQRLRHMGITSGRVTLKNPSRVVRVTFSQASQVIWGKLSSQATPALFTRTPMFSPSSSSASTAGVAWVRSATSNLHSRTSPPSASMAAFTCSAASSLLR